MNDHHRPRALPRLNEPAPAFDAVSTHGPLNLEGYCGSWVVLFSHPADFTPVCTTEFIAFARAHGRFEGLGCKLVGLSVDSTFSHIAWVRNIKERFDVDVDFPIIDDTSMRIASAYGMIQPGESDTSAVRAVFVIDPDGMLRAMMYYPMTTGRSVAEILRLVEALQTTAQRRVATPEGWTPGDKVLDLPPRTLDEVKRRDAGDAVDWYFNERDLS